MKKRILESKISKEFSSEDVENIMSESSAAKTKTLLKPEAV